MKPLTAYDVMKMDHLACRDWLAQWKGWKSNGCYWQHETLAPHMYFPGSRYGDHPIPDTLDAAAACLPDKLLWWKQCKLAAGSSATDASFVYEEWQWYWCAAKPGSTHRAVKIPATDDEKLDRFRLAILAISAKMEAKEKP